MSFERKSKTLTSTIRADVNALEGCQVENNERRAIILQAAERLLEHYGVHKTTVSDIAREADIGVGSVYLEFGSKDDIIGHVASQKHGGILERLERAAQNGGNSSDRVRAFLSERVAAFRSFAECGTHASELVHCKCSPVEASWAAYQDRELSLLAGLISEGIEGGEFRAGDARELAATVLRAYASFTPPGLFGRPQCDGLDAMHELVIRGLVA